MNNPDLCSPIVWKVSIPSRRLSGKPELDGFDHTWIEVSARAKQINNKIVIVSCDDVKATWAPLYFCLIIANEISFVYLII